MPETHIHWNASSAQGQDINSWSQWWNHSRSGDALLNTILRYFMYNKNTQWAGQQVKTWEQVSHNVVNYYVQKRNPNSLQLPQIALTYWWKIRYNYPITKKINILKQLLLSFKGYILQLCEFPKLCLKNHQRTKVYKMQTMANLVVQRIAIFMLY